MRAVRTAAVLAAATGCALAGAGTAAPASAAGAQTLLNMHVSVSSVGGALPKGAGISVIQHCPKGSDLDRTQTRAVGEFHDERLRVRSTELWPAGTVVRYRVAERLSADEPAFALTAAVCRTRVAAGAQSLRVKAKVDLRVWGPAPADVEMVSIPFAVVTDDLDAASGFRSSLEAAGVDEHPEALQDAVDAVQESFSDEGDSFVIATGTTRRKVARGEFVSLRNHYRVTADLTQREEW
jgi:hypothetical protein